MEVQTSTRLIEHVDYYQIAEGVWGMKDIFVNFYMIANSVDGTWVLVDTGVSPGGKKVKAMAREIFGEGSRPSCIILTHAHFDHIGSLKVLAAEWNVPVYAHALEIPYITGMSDYPPPDPSVGGGLISTLAFTYPKKPIDIGDRAMPLASEGQVPFLWGWDFYHTPGHTPGHIVLFRSQDKTLIAGDAVVTTNPQSIWSTLLQLKVLSGPPQYFTYNWNEARASVNKIWKLEPEIIASGHGRPMKGHEMRMALNKLEHDFDLIAMPKKGRYVEKPARAGMYGVTYVPPKKLPVKTMIAAGVILFAITNSLIKRQKKKRLSNNSI